MVNELTHPNAPTPPPNGSFRKALDFSTGHPVPVFVPIMAPKDITETLAYAMSCPYKPKIDPVTEQPYPDEQEFLGCTNMQVMQMRRARAAANGDFEVARHLEDRLLGKPMQQVQQTTVNMTLQQYLSQLADKLEESENEVVATTVTVTSTTPTNSPYDNVLNDLKELGI